MSRGGAFVVLDIEETCIVQFALEDYRRQSISRREARTLLELGGLIERKPL